MPMSPRLLRPRTGGTHPEATAWRTAVLANGGTVTSSTLKAVSDFCATIDKTAGLRGCFYRLNLFCGTGLEACLVPLYRGTSRTGTQYGNTTDSAVNFVSGDYSESQGLSSASAGKMLNTGLASSSMPSNAGHLAWSVRGGSFVSSGFLLGFSSAGGYRSYAFISNASSLSMGSASGSTVEVFSVLSSYARHVVNRLSSASLVYYRNGVSTSSNSNTATASSGGADQLSIFGTNGSASARAGLHYYAVGDSMTASQVAAFDLAISQFLTALGRT